MNFIENFKKELYKAEKRTITPKYEEMKLWNHKYICVQISVIRKSWIRLNEYSEIVI
jgi:hypothetical protein